MPYYRKRKKSDDTWVFMTFGILVGVVGLIVVLSLLSLGLLGLGVALTKVFPALNLFHATLVPLVLLVSIGLYITIALSAIDLKESLSPTRPEPIVLDDPSKPRTSEGWRYGREETARLDI